MLIPAIQVGSEAIDKHSQPVLLFRKMRTSDHDGRSVAAALDTEWSTMAPFRYALRGEVYVL